jgi:curved DNA-binding protein CbpA
MTPPLTDLYAILGLSPRATQTQVSQAYRALLRQRHPDTRALTRGQSDTDADAALQALFAAYEVLGDPARRAAYDHRRRLARARTPHKVPIHYPQVGPTLNPPIQAGPVRWQPAGVKVSLSARPKGFEPLTF